ncbi:MAG: hypothetical protein Q4E02_02525 [Lagierella massiliensis]|nr:hypothetical protein [Lagierella massiliensis]
MIYKNKSFSIKNAISYRKKLTQIELNSKSNEIENYIKDMGAEIVDCTISVTYAIEESGDEKLIDTEFIIPVSKKIELIDDMQWVDEFNIENALMTNYKGPMMGLNQSFIELTDYIKSNNIVPKSPFLIVTKRDNNVQLGVYVDVDIYVEM